MLPGITIMTALGSRLERLWREPSLGNVAVLAVLLVLWIALALGVQRWLGRRIVGRADAGE